MEVIRAAFIGAVWALRTACIFHGQQPTFSALRNMTLANLRTSIAADVKQKSSSGWPSLQAAWAPYSALVTIGDSPGLWQWKWDLAAMQAADNRAWADASPRLKPRKRWHIGKSRLRNDPGLPEDEHTEIEAWAHFEQEFDQVIFAEIFMDDSMGDVMEIGDATLLPWRSTIDRAVQPTQPEGDGPSLKLDHHGRQREENRTCSDQRRQDKNDRPVDKRVEGESGGTQIHNAQRVGDNRGQTGGEQVGMGKGDTLVPKGLDCRSDRHRHDGNRDRTREEQRAMGRGQSVVAKRMDGQQGRHQQDDTIGRGGQHIGLGRRQQPSVPAGAQRLTDRRQNDNRDRSGDEHLDNHQGEMLVDKRVDRQQERYRCDEKNGRGGQTTGPNLRQQLAVSGDLLDNRMEEAGEVEGNPTDHKMDEGREAGVQVLKRHQGGEEGSSGARWEKGQGSQEKGAHPTQGGWIRESSESAQEKQDTPREEHRPDEMTGELGENGGRQCKNPKEPPKDSHGLHAMICEGLSGLQLGRRHTTQPLSLAKSLQQEQERIRSEAREELESLWDVTMAEPQHKLVGEKRTRNRKKARRAAEDATAQESSASETERAERSKASSDKPSSPILPPPEALRLEPGTGWANPLLLSSSASLSLSPAVGPLASLQATDSLKTGDSVQVDNTELMVDQKLEKEQENPGPIQREEEKRVFDDIHVQRMRLLDGKFDELWAQDRLRIVPLVLRLEETKLQILLKPLQGQGGMPLIPFVKFTGHPSLQKAVAVAQKWLADTSAVLPMKGVSAIRLLLKADAGDSIGAYCFMLRAETLERTAQLGASARLMEISS
ncbi:hypothetical protein CBR_g57346 [Chara braunii]|uniref:Uncharacterized protein n=1 Tax=Chara braunii TaxID=69332 RepID=A0A388ME40_CHABU|nr:hypothetical protein CBR_g57346 [Chara braunii]|eukprot:GBG92826.1 hypothetical protein CBR_g57346 [Chara braunii]